MPRRCFPGLLAGVLSLLTVLAAPGLASGSTGSTGSTAAAPAPRAGSGYVVDAAFEARVLTLANRRRERAGCRPLRLDARLQAAARSHSTAMARAASMAHELPGEPGIVQRIVRAGYTPWRRLAENLGAGFLSPRSVVRAWMRSPGHRRNLLDCRLRESGVGVVRAGTQLWWTQDFGRR